jgi:hydroxyquinol 1,2-dioxygenase
MTGMEDGATKRTTPQDITDRVVASFDRTETPRTREIMQSLVRHLHAFVAEVGLTQEEWQAGIAALTATGQITDERRQEFILWSGSRCSSMHSHTPSRRERRSRL